MQFHFTFKRHSKANQAIHKAELFLRNADSLLVDALTASIDILNEAIDEESEDEKDAQGYSKDDLARVLLAASNYHLKLKLGKRERAQSPDLELLSYLNPMSTNSLSFASTCKRVFEELETSEGESDRAMARVYYTELRNIYLYLLSRID